MDKEQVVSKKDGDEEGEEDSWEWIIRESCRAERREGFIPPRGESKERHGESNGQWKQEITF